MQVGYFAPPAPYHAVSVPDLVPSAAGGLPPTNPPCSDWSPREDYLLLQAVNQFGLGDWTRIAKVIGTGRTKSQCSQHWYRCLNPAMVKGRWDPEEDEKLRQMVEKFGPKNWVRIAKGMGTRSDVQCRHRYMNICKGKLDKMPGRMRLPSIESLLNSGERISLSDLVSAGRTEGQESPSE
jgi:hypothetical protein